MECRLAVENWMKTRHWWLVIVAAAVRVLGAQTPVPRQGTLIPIPSRTFVAFDPSVIVFDIFSLEVENAVAPGVTAGGVGSYTVVNDDRYTTADFNLRYYPGEVVLRGVSFGLSGGVLRYSALDSARERASIIAPTIGILADYNWLIGPSKRFVVGTGVGAKRVLASADDRRRVDLPRAYLTARFVVGYAF
jgi:hypothetical protein